MRPAHALAAFLLLAPSGAMASQGSTIASWYGPELNGRRTASGERFDSRQLTAAHRRYPMGTVMLISRGDRHVVVRINDRGPHVRGRGLDLSEAAARQLGIRDQGVARVSYRIIHRPGTARG